MKRKEFNLLNKNLLPKRQFFRSNYEKLHTNKVIDYITDRMCANTNQDSGIGNYSIKSEEFLHERIRLCLPIPSVLSGDNECTLC